MSENINDQKNSGEEEAMEKIYSFIIEQLKNNVDKATITQKLVEMGVEKNEADKLVDEVSTEIIKTTEKEHFTAKSLLPGLLGGVLAAVVGGIVWGLIVMLTDYEVGFMAWGIGALVGFGVMLFTKGKKEFPYKLWLFF